ncbi:ATP-binding protein, partial [bacterium]
MSSNLDFRNTNLKKILRPYNIWWENSQFETKKFKRPVFHKIYSDLFNIKQMISIIGPRRVGKTTILKQIIQDLINKNNIDPHQIIYFSFDDPLMFDQQRKEHFFEKLIKWVDTNIPKKPIYFFLDEIQQFEKWELYLKKYYDLEFPFRFIISGSASSPIFKKSRESLLGRVKNYHLLPFSFKEYVAFNKSDDNQFLEFIDIAQKFGSNLQRNLLIDWGDNSLSPLNISNDIFNELNKLLDNYFIEGGFPEAWEIEDIVTKQEYLFDNQIQKVIFEDLVITTEFRKPENIKKFYLSLIEQPGQELNIDKISQKIKVSRAMVEKYLPLLEMTELVKNVGKFSRKAFKMRRGNIKCYLVDLALRNAIFKLNEEVLQDKTLMGYYAENVVFNALREFHGVIELSYYRKNKKEVDFIVNLGGKKYLPIEVKYRNKIDDLQGIEYFIKNYNQQFG